MKKRKSTTRHHHMRTVKSGKVTPVRQHQMKYWSKLPKPTSTYRGRYYTSGRGTQSVRTFELPRKGLVEITKATFKDGDGWYEVRGRSHEWSGGKWIGQDYQSKKEAEDIAKIMLSEIDLDNTQKPQTIESKINKDTDKDGVPDSVDCKPYDASKQDKKDKKDKLMGIVILSPTKKYIKEYGEGNYEKASKDLAEWFGLIGNVFADGHIEMNVRKEDYDEREIKRYDSYKHLKSSIKGFGILAKKVKL